MRIRLLPVLLPALLLVLCITFIRAQQGFFAFHHFKSYPAGRWTTEGQGFRNGKPAGPVESTTSCSSPLSSTEIAKIKEFSNNAASTCTMRVITDQPLIAEVEQTCHFGPNQQSIHQTLHAVDDKTVTSEVRSAIGGSETVMKTTAHYLGVCSASEAAAAKAAPSILKPDPALCAQLPEMKKGSQEALQSCAQVPAGFRADCVTRVQASVRATEVLTSGCK